MCIKCADDHDGYESPRPKKIARISVLVPSYASEIGLQIEAAQLLFDDEGFGEVNYEAVSIYEESDNGFGQVNSESLCIVGESEGVDVEFPTECESVNEHIEELVSMSSFHAALNVAVNNVGTSSSIKMPWEQGFVGFVLGTSATCCMPYFCMPSPRNVPMPSVPEFTPMIASAPVRVSKLPALTGSTVPWITVVSRKKQKAIASWSVLINAFPRCSRTWFLMQGLDEANAMLTLTDTLEGKSSGTIQQRAGSMMMYCRWIKVNSEEGAWPLREDMIYRYVSRLRTDKAPATRAKRFCESVNFAIHVWRDSRSRDRKEPANLGGFFSQHANQA